MSAIFLYDDQTARSFEPFALTRPLAELRVGAMLVRERWERALGAAATASVCAPHLADFFEPGATAVAAGELPAGALLVNARAIPSVESRGGATMGHLRIGGRVAAVRLERALPLAALRDGAVTLESLLPRHAAAEELPGQWIEAVWDLVATLVPLLTEDIPRLARERDVPPAEAPDGCRLLGRTDDGGHELFVEEGATIEPFVTFDLSAGPIYVERGATVQSFTRLAGPSWIGRESIVGGDRVSAVIVGDTCKVHGEVSNTVFLGHCNKGHDGFVGHSYLGRWVNLGANTVTSNLKNTYDSVSLWTPAGTRDSGQQFLGTLFGDHAKTGIGLTLTTGTVVGAGAQVFGLHMPPKVVPPFSWGDAPPYQLYRLDKFLQVAERVLARRHVELAEQTKRQLTAAHAARWSVES